MKVKDDKICYDHGRLICLGFNVAFNTVYAISQRVVSWAAGTSTYSWSRFCSVKCLPVISNYQLSYIGSGV